MHPRRDGRNAAEDLTFEQIAQAMNKDEVWATTFFCGQVSCLPTSSFFGTLYDTRPRIYSLHRPRRPQAGPTHGRCKFRCNLKVVKGVNQSKGKGNKTHLFR